MNTFLDIETIPQQPEEEAKSLIVVEPPGNMSKAETIQAWHKGDGKYKGAKEDAIEEKYRKTALNGTYGEIISITMHIDGWPIKSYSRALGESEEDMLWSFVNELNLALSGRPPYFIGHNITFDLRFIVLRCIINKIKLPFKIPCNGRHKSDFYCTMTAWAGFGKMISQDNLCKALGIEGKPGDISGANVWDFVKAGDIKRVVEYNKDDVRKVKQMFSRMDGYL